MSPRITQAGGRERNAPADRRVIERLFELAGEIERLLSDHTEELDYAAYEDLSSYETKLLAYGNFLASSPTAREQLVQEAITEAESCLAYAQRRIGGGS